MVVSTLISAGQVVGEKPTLLVVVLMVLAICQNVGGKKLKHPAFRSPCLLTLTFLWCSEIQIQTFKSLKSLVKFLKSLVKSLKIKSLFKFLFKFTLIALLNPESLSYTALLINC